MTDTSCVGGSVQCWIISQVSILTNIGHSLIPIQKMLTGGAYLIGIMFVFKGIYSLKQYGESKSMMSNAGSVKEPILYTMVGAMLIYFPTTFQLIMNSTFGYENVLQYAPINSKNQALDALFGAGSVVGEPLCMVIQVVGLVAFIRGWVLIARSASQGQPPGGTGKGLIHVFGGVLGVNIVGTINMVNNTLYGG
ncbi:MAG: type IV secretion protein IcmC [Legionella sp.]